MLFPERTIRWASLAVMLFAAAVLVSNSVNAQEKVQDPKYALLLNNLLSHNVPERTVPDIGCKIPDGLVFLDAREYEEYEVSHIRNAVWVGYDDFDLSRLEGLDKNGTYLVYCSVGYRSEKVASQLIDAGFTNVSNLYGGIFEWKNAGCPVYKGDVETMKVHAFDRIWGIWLRAGEKVY